MKSSSSMRCVASPAIDAIRVERPPFPVESQALSKNVARHALISQLGRKLQRGEQAPALACAVERFVAHVCNQVDRDAQLALDWSEVVIRPRKEVVHLSLPVGDRAVERQEARHGACTARVGQPWRD
eukprot:7389743-Prymnesium_polylepis.1